MTGWTGRLSRDMRCCVWFGHRWEDRVGLVIWYTGEIGKEQRHTRTFWSGQTCERCGLHDPPMPPFTIPNPAIWGE